MIEYKISRNKSEIVEQLYKDGHITWSEIFILIDKEDYIIPPIIAPYPNYPPVWYSDTFRAGTGTFSTDNKQEINDPTT